MKRVLVTGATGFVAANLTRQLIRDGHDTHLLLREGSNQWRLRQGLRRTTDWFRDHPSLERYYRERIADGPAGKRP
jgi:nucleoside-diphosphate-sugar epimerase